MASCQEAPWLASCSLSTKGSEVLQVLSFCSIKKREVRQRDLQEFPGSCTDVSAESGAEAQLRHLHKCLSVAGRIKGEGYRNTGVKTSPESPAFDPELVGSLRLCTSASSRLPSLCCVDLSSAYIMLLLCQAPF